MTNQKLAQAGWQELLRWLLHRRYRFHVENNSMLPLLAPEDTVFVDRAAYRHRRPTPGDVVVALHPHQRGLKLIKRVASVSARGDCFLISDNPDEGTDSHTFGAIPAQGIIGRVTSLA